jgi:hypothetical protein
MVSTMLGTILKILDWTLAMGLDQGTVATEQLRFFRSLTAMLRNLKNWRTRIAIGNELSFPLASNQVGHDVYYLGMLRLFIPLSLCRNKDIHVMLDPAAGYDAAGQNISLDCDNFPS